MPNRWEGGAWNEAAAEDESWVVEIEHDCFESAGYPYVVSVQVNDADTPEGALAIPSPKQARQMARALNVAADAAERANLRIEAAKAARDA